MAVRALQKNGPPCVVDLVFGRCFLGGRETNSGFLFFFNCYYEWIVGPISVSSKCTRTKIIRLWIKCSTLLLLFSLSFVESTGILCINCLDYSETESWALCSFPTSVCSNKCDDQLHVVENKWKESLLRSKHQQLLHDLFWFCSNLYSSASFFFFFFSDWSPI